MTSGAHRTPDRYRQPVGPLAHRCARCSRVSGELSRCTGCCAVRYCGSEHQTAHWLEHKATCSGVKKARRRLKREDNLLRRNPSTDSETPANAFETDDDEFWTSLSVLTYKRARYGLAMDHLALIGTLDSVQEALEHVQDLLRLCPTDNTGLRDVVPALLLRLDHDQDCYGFIKRWMVSAVPEGDRSLNSLQYLDTYDADIMEDADFFAEYRRLPHVIAVLLLKLKVLIDIRNLKVARNVISRCKLPFDLLVHLEPMMIRSHLSEEFVGACPSDLKDAEILLQGQVIQIGHVLHEINPHFTFQLLNPHDALSMEPEMMFEGSRGDSAIALQHCYAAWLGTDGLLDVLRDAYMFAHIAAAEEGDNIMESNAVPSTDGSERTREQVLRAVSVARLWSFVDVGFEMSAHLGDPFDGVDPRIKNIAADASQI